MALYNVKVKIEYTFDALVEGAPSAEEAMRRAAIDADDAIKSIFEDDLEFKRAEGKSTPLSAVCVNGLE